jgi:hypothetical protein
VNARPGGSGSRYRHRRAERSLKLKCALLPTVLAQRSGSPKAILRPAVSVSRKSRRAREFRYSTGKDRSSRRSIMAQTGHRSAPGERASQHPVGVEVHFLRNTRKTECGANLFSNYLGGARRTLCASNYFSSASAFLARSRSSLSGLNAACSSSRRASASWPLTA